MLAAKSRGVLATRGDNIVAARRTNPWCAYVTVSVFFMNEWMLQWYGYEPGVEGAVNVADLPGLMVPASNWPAVSDVRVCAVESSFLTVTVEPAFTVAVVNLKLLIVMVFPEAVPPGAGVVPDFLLLLLQAARLSASIATTM